MGTQAFLFHTHLGGHLEFVGSLYRVINVQPENH